MRWSLTIAITILMLTGISCATTEPIEYRGEEKSVWLTVIARDTGMVTGEVIESCNQYNVVLLEDVTGNGDWDNKISMRIRCRGMNSREVSLFQAELLRLQDVRDVRME